MSSSATKYPTRPDIKGDAERVIRVLQNGGVALAPASIGYGAITSSPRKIEEIFIAKGRAPTKRHAMAGSYAVHRELHIMAPRDQEIVDHLVHDLDVPVAVIAKFNDKHPMFSNLDDVTMEALSVNGTLAILINGGRFQDELARLGLAADVPILGSSANITGTGTKFRVEDIPQEILSLCDDVVDYGLAKYSNYVRSSTMIDFSGPVPDIVRIGACYELIKDALWRRFGIKTPDDPGFEKNKWGHLKTQTPLKSLEALITSRTVST